jgi:hypothetical protein
MKVYISYVVQGENDHQHCSEIIDVESSFYVTRESVVMQIKNWLDQKQSELPADRKLILLNKFEF